MTQLTRKDLYPYQIEAVAHILNRHGSMLWLDIGLGKTAISLTAIEYLLDSYRVKAVLILAPKKVTEAVWEQEARKWQHTSRLRFSVIRGGAIQRLKALHAPADVYLANYEQIEWLVGRYKTEEYVKKTGEAGERSVFQEGALFTHFLNKGLPLPFDMSVYDEVSRMKTSTAKRTRAFTKILPHMAYRVGLTGTPASNGIGDLHGQYLMVDGGHRLGPNITSFRARWMIQDAYGRKWVPRKRAMDEIKDLISDITLEMKRDDYLTLPPRIDQDIVVEMPEAAAKLYQEFEKNFFVELDACEIEAFNSGAKSTKCRQLANGAVYANAERTTWAAFHDAKLEAVSDIVESLAGKSLLICYQFKHDVERLVKLLPGATVIDQKNVSEKVAAWNRGEIKQLIGHPASMGHGLNLQYGGNHIIWFGLPWSLELYDQAIGRLERNGQGEIVVNHRIIAKGTVEEGIAEALQSKGRAQADLREAVKEYRRRKLQ